MAIFIIGATGLVGAHFLSCVVESSQEIVTLSRRLPTLFKDSTPPNVKTIVDTDSKSWSQDIKDADIPEHSTFFSAFGTTRATAGSAERFKEIDYGVNYESFKAAKDTGKFDTAILVSSVGANPDSLFLYTKTKGELERDVQALGFKRTVILRPGILLGERDTPKNFANKMAAHVGNWIRNTPLDSFGTYPIYGEEVAKAAKIIAESPIEKELLIYNSKEIRDIAEKGSL